MPSPPPDTTSVLLTDLYQLTMAYGYWRHDRHEHEAVFHLFFRQCPFGSGYAIVAGLEQAVAWLEHFHFGEEEIAYLHTLQGNDGKPLFNAAFLKYLAQLEFHCDIDAIPEGTVVFPHEPLVRVRGPILQAQIIETALLNIINFQTLIATKSARIVEAAGSDPVLEFGLRRAQGVDGALAASRAAYIGGAAATSNVLAGMRYGIPVKGTHAHSWVMSFENERQSFKAYAEAMPNNCVFLVDTYDTLEGVHRAIEIGRWLREAGSEMVGIRLDSGDLASLSIEARRMLDEAGFSQAAIVASNDLDEHIIKSLKEQGATIGLWGVGTKLVTGHDQPALGGVYKLGAIKTRDTTAWTYRLKLSEQAIKVSNPGILQVRRFFRGNEAIGDMLFNEAHADPSEAVLIDPEGSGRRRVMPQEATNHDLLQPVFRRGRNVASLPSLEAIRDRAKEQRGQFPAGVRRFLNPQKYPVGLEPALHRLKRALIAEAEKQG